MQLSNKPRSIKVVWGSSAGGSYIRSVPDFDAPTGAASYATGFPPETFQPLGSGGSPPAGQDVNGVLSDLTGWSRWVESGASAMFDPDFAAAVGGYPKYAVLASTTPGRVWQSTADNNATDPDSTSAANWIALVIPPGDTSQNILRHPSGFVEQWGSVAASSTGEPVIGVSLLTPYADAGYNISVTGAINSASAYSDTWAQIVRGSKTTTGFAVQYQRGAGATQPNLDGFDWRCIGRGA